MRQGCPLLRLILLAAVIAAGTSIGVVVATASPRWVHHAVKQLAHLHTDSWESTAYSRPKDFGGWKVVNGCSTREIILKRDLTDLALQPGKTCKAQVRRGLLHDPYTGGLIRFDRKTPTAVPIDHVVALKDAWRTGARHWSRLRRVEFANDPAELLAVGPRENSIKRDNNAFRWLPPNKAYECSYVAAQITIKTKYVLWVTASERKAMFDVLTHDC